MLVVVPAVVVPAVVVVVDLAGDVEVATLSRSHGRRAFRRVTNGELTSILSGDAAAEPAAGRRRRTSGGPDDEAAAEGGDSGPGPAG